jgi:hypothetical protein
VHSGTTTAREGVVWRPFFPLREFARVRRAWTPLLLAVLFGVLTAWLGENEIRLPISAGSGEVTLPMWSMLAMAAGTLPALGLHSALASLEETRTDIHLRVEHRYLLALSLLSFGGYLAVAATTLDTAILSIILRSLPGWLGLALLSGRLLGWRLSWVLPLGMWCVLAYCGPDSA